MGDPTAPMSPTEWVLLAAVGGVVGNLAWVVCVVLYRWLANGAQAAAGRVATYFQAPLTNVVLMPLVMLIGAAFVAAFLQFALLHQGIAGGIEAVVGYIVRAIGIIKLPVLPGMSIAGELVATAGAWIVGLVVAGVGILMQFSSRVRERIPLRTPVLRAVIAAVIALTVSLLLAVFAWGYVASWFGAA